MFSMGKKDWPKSGSIAASAFLQSAAARNGTGTASNEAVEVKGRREANGSLPACGLVVARRFHLSRHGFGAELAPKQH